MTLPAGIRHMRTLEGHSDTVGRVGWSPDGRLIASPARDGEVRLWDAESGACLRSLTVPGGARDAAFDPAGRLLGVAGDSRTVGLWDVETGELVHNLECVSFTNCLAFSPAGDVLATGSGRVIRLWDTENGKVVAQLEGHPAHTMGVAFDRDGKLLATGGYDRRVCVWDVATHALVHEFKGHGNDVIDVAFHPDGRAVISCGNDNTIKVWDLASGRLVRTLEGHTGSVKGFSFTSGGRIMASKARDETVRIWDSETGESLAVMDVPGTASWQGSLAFHPQLPLLAATAAPPVHSAEADEDLIHVWELAVDRLLGGDRVPSLTYASAKIVLVGDSGVGKTGLGWRLAHGEFIEHSSTHGQQFWMLEQLRGTRSDGAECEAILWDLAGQPDYRLIHALFLDDADLALVLFDPTRDEDPLHGVEYWLRQLRIGETGSGARSQPGPDALLVAARTDRGAGHLAPDEVEAFCAQRGVRGYVVTSALQGEGLDELVDRMRGALDWERSPVTVTTDTFKRIKDHVLGLKEARSGQVILSVPELRERLEREEVAGDFSDEELLSAVGHLSNHGYVTRLRTTRGETRVLLAPELLNNVASSIVLEARRNEKGLGSLEEQRVLGGDYSFPELQGLSAPDRDVLLDSAVAMFLDHNVCFRETDPLTSRVYLVFPELINLKKPVVDDEQPVQEGVAYTATGQVENVYASLVVLLGYTTTFTRTHQWSNQARYVVGEGMVCGFRLEEEREGELDFVLYFGATVGEPVRKLFQSLFESFLARRDLAIQRYEPVMCLNGHRVNRAVVREHLAEGRERVFCSSCGDEISLPSGDGRIQLTQEQAADVRTLHRAADTRASFERYLFRLKTYVTEAGIVPPTCFVSYAWGDPAQERWVEEELATDLVKAGITVILDRWENSRIGASVPRFLERVTSADRVVVVGTPLYRSKYDNGEPMRGFAAAAEGDLVGTRMIGSEAEKLNVLPVLLSGSQEQSLPPLLQGRVYGDFREPEQYFVTALDLILSLYEIPAQDPVGSELRQAMVRRFS